MNDTDSKAPVIHGVNGELAIEYLPVDQLVPYARNARTHSEEQIASLIASFKEFGWTSPVIIDNENTVRAGHGRILAAQQLGVKNAPCIRLAHLSERQLRAYVVADNRLAELAGWDKGLLSLELSELTLEEFDFAAIGFSDEDIEQLTTFEESNAEPPQAFKTYDKDIKTEHVCPKCGYEWNGNGG